MQFPTYKEMGKKIAETALDDVTINDKSLREWVDTICTVASIENPEKVINTMKTEKACITRSDTCDRDCSKCDLVMDATELKEVYDTVIDLLIKLYT